MLCHIQIDFQIDFLYCALYKLGNIMRIVFGSALQIVQNGLAASALGTIYFVYTFVNCAC